MNAGQLDRRITVMEYTETRGDAGQMVKAWTPMLTLWAQYQETGGKEGYNADQEAAFTDAVFTIRSSLQARQINPKHRIQYAGINYDILTVNQGGIRDEFRRITTRRRAD